MIVLSTRLAGSRAQKQEGLREFLTRGNSLQLGNPFGSKDESDYLENIKKRKAEMNLMRRKSKETVIGGQIR